MSTFDLNNQHAHNGHVHAHRDGSVPHEHQQQDGLTQPTHAGQPPRAGGQQGRAGADGSRTLPLRPVGNGWTQNSPTVGAATLLLLISLFLPWYTVSGYGPFGFVSVSVDSIQGHTWMWSSLIICLTVIALLVARASEQLRSTVPSGAWPLTGLTGLNLLLVLAAFFGRPVSGIPVSGQLVRTIVLAASAGNAGIPVSWGIGAYAGLVCALVAAGSAGLAIRRRA